MRPGFRNLQPIRHGEQLANDLKGPILATETGRVLMPLYQSQGEDGFFVVKTVRPFWLKVALWARLIGFDRVLRFLPGVLPHPEMKDGFIVDVRIARWLVVPIFHLMGFRRRRSEAGRLVLSRRRERARIRLTKLPLE